MSSTTSAGNAGFLSTANSAKATSMEISELVSHLVQNAPGFAARLDAAGVAFSDIQSTEDLNRIPVMRKDDLADLQAESPPFGGFLACSPAELKRVFQSPGPIYDPESRVSDYWRWAPALRANGFGRGDIVLNAFGYHLTPAGAMFEEGLWAVGCAVIPGGVGNLEQQVQAMHTLGVNGYVGLPSYLKALLDRAAEMDLPLKLEKAFVTAEPLPTSLREYINNRGITIRQGYGTAECGNLGFECEQQDGWHIPTDAFIQVCDISTGQPLPPGEVGEIVTTLFAPDYALVRFGTGDLSTINSGPCACGLTSARLMGWQGRVGDAVKVRGMFLHPQQLRQLMLRFPEVVRWQAVIDRREHKDYLTLRVVLTPEANLEQASEQLVRDARENIKFQVAVQPIPAEALAEGAPPIEDTRTWE